MHRLIQQTFVRFLGNPALRRLEDAAVLKVGGQWPVASGRSGHQPPATGHKPLVRIALTTDSYVVQPLFFPGGDIGKLAVCGTVNDLAVMGAQPRYLSTGFIISTGFPISDLERICRSMAVTAKRADVEVVTGDTKVVENKAEKRLGAEGPKHLSSDAQSLRISDLGFRCFSSPELFINTSGVGEFDHGRRFGAEHIRPGDRVLINGSIGDHEAAIVLARGEFEFKGRLASDCAPLNGLIQGLLQSRADVRMMRDPTRGGVATTLNEIAQASGLGIIIDEANLKVRPEVHGVCQLLGFEPLYLANEGKVLVVVAPSSETRALTALRRHPLGRAASTIAFVTSEREGVWLKTRLGSLRPVLMLEGQQLPRIC